MITVSPSNPTWLTGDDETLSPLVDRRLTECAPTVVVLVDGTPHTASIEHNGVSYGLRLPCAVRRGACVELAR